MKTSRQFYTEFGVKKLVKRKAKIHTIKELAYLKKLISKKQKILDLACGYGRFTSPLAKQGYRIEGIDITPFLIKQAKETAKKEKIKVKFKVGDMRSLPYKKESFDVILCMWSALNELIKKSEQLRAIKEMLRVLRKEGFVLIEMPSYKSRSYKIIKIGKDEFKFNRKTKLSLSKLNGIEAMPLYMHNKKTLTRLMKKAKIKKFKVFIDNFGGRNRLFLKFWKC